MSDQKKTRPLEPGWEAEVVPLDIDGVLEGSEKTREAYETHADVLQVGELIRDMRIARGFSQNQLAERAGTTQSHISQLERGIGRQGPTIEMLSRIGRACGEHIQLVTRAGHKQTVRVPAAAELKMARKLALLKFALLRVREEYQAKPELKPKRRVSYRARVTCKPVKRHGRYERI
jgi:transcriptional regulator with XRE-family HTH domain